jgi:PAS domain S-box-containing protein
VPAPPRPTDALLPGPQLRQSRWWLAVAAIAAAYAATAALGLALPYVGSYITLIWMPSGIAVAALLRGGLGLWPGVALGALIGNLAADLALLPTLAICVTNTAGPLLAAWLLWRLDFDADFRHRRDVLLLAGVAATGAMALTASGGVLTLAAAGLVPAERMAGAWFTWWLGDAVGVLVAGVPLLLLLRPGVPRRLAPPGRALESALLIGAVLLLAAWLFMPVGRSATAALHAVLDEALVFVPFALLVWLALRTGLLAASVTVLAFSALAAWGTAQGVGPFALGTPHHGLMLLWAYMVTAAMIVLLLGALVAELDSRDRLADALVTCADSAILFIGADGRVLRANPAAHALFGARALRGGEAALFDGTDARLPALLAQRAQDGRAQGQLAVQRADGTRLEAEVSSMLLEAGAADPVACVVVRDISARVEAAAALAANEARLTLALAAGGMGAWAWDAQTDTSTWDAACYAMYGAPPEEPASFARLLAQVHADDRERLAEAVYGASRNGGAIDVEYRIVDADGSVRHVVGRGRGETDAQGRLLRVHGVSFDVTAQREAERALRAAEAAERASRAKTEFLSRMSHELRTPLNAVLGFAQLLTLDPQLSARSQDHTRRILDAGRHLLAMINDVLDLARIEAGHAGLAIAAVDLRAALAQALQMQQPMAEAAGVALIDATGSGPRAFARADARRLQQVLANLLSNAIKYNRRGGRVLVRCAAAGALWRIEVEDTGRGLSAAQRAHLFEPFNRLGAEASGVEGTGIGLTVVKSLVELMQGQVEVRSEPGQGACFTVLLPAAPVTPVDAVGRATPASNDAAAAPRVRRRVLCVEDNPVNVQLLQQALALLPEIELQVATSGAEALAMARGARPDLLLLDMHLGDLSGLELKRRLDDDEATRDLPCIVVSADAMPERQRAAHAAGVLDYLTKPFDVPQLLSCVRRALAVA